MYKTILVPVDGSPFSESILAQVKLLARANKASVILLKVVEPPLLLGRDEVIDDDAYERQRSRIKQEAESYLSNIRDQLLAEGVRAEIVVESGSVVAAIFKTADSAGADLIAMTSHGWHGLRQRLHDSTAAGLLQRTGPSLLIDRSGISAT